MDRFSFFFAFYGLILGLAVTELLGGFVAFARERRIRDLEPQTGLLALLIFVDICATWLDAWETLKDVTLNLEGLFAPILLATAFYLASGLVFPRKSADLDALDEYYRKRKWFVATMLLIVELLVGYTFIGTYERKLANAPAVFWLWHVPYKLLLLSGFVWLIAARGKRSNIAALSFLLLLFTVPYWTRGAIPNWIHQTFDAPPLTARRTR